MLSVLVVRHPISRLLSDFATCDSVDKSSGNANKATLAAMLGNLERNQAKNGGQAISFDNYALRILAGAAGSKRSLAAVTQADFERAKRNVGRFSVVLDQECLGHGVAQLVRTLGLQDKYKDPITNHKSKPPRETCGNDVAYERLVELNKFDIELFEYARSISLVRCADIDPAQPVWER